MKDEYIKISKYVSVHKGDIECLCPYGNGITAEFVKGAKDRGKYDKSHQKRIMSLIILKDGQVFTGPYSVKTYLSRLDAGQFLRTDRGACVRDSLVKKQVHTLNQFYRSCLKEKKETDCYLKLAGNKAVRTYLFMESGYVYGCRTMKTAESNQQDNTEKEE